MIVYLGSSSVQGVSEREVGDAIERVGIQYDMSLAASPRGRHMVIAILDGELTIKYLSGDLMRLALCAENPTFPDITIPELSEFPVSGVVTWVLYRGGRV